jgi:hypothetical protein
MSIFSWFTICIEVGPEGFTTPKRPDRGSEGDLGMVAGYERADCYEIKLVMMIVIQLDYTRLHTGPSYSKLLQMSDLLLDCLLITVVA